MAAAEAAPLGSLHLILMSRAPVAGQTKTRLSPPLSPEAARSLHVACINDLLAEGRSWRAERLARGVVPVTLHLFITPPASQAAFRAAGVEWPDDYALHNQRGESLGERMAHAIRRVQAGTAAPAGVLLVGTDLPLLRAACLERATEALGSADAVFGPTPDGGYYLVGVRCDPAGLFDVEGWGSLTVLQRTLDAARADGLRTALVEPLPDVDRAEDLVAVLRHPLADVLAGRQSMRLIRALGTHARSGD